MDVIGRGAEAILTRTGEGIVKERPVKSYRHPAIDRELRTGRTRAEARIMHKARQAGIPVPQVIQIDDHTLRMDEAPGVPLKQVLDGKPALAQRVGELIARLHDRNIIHADLTTSNMLYDSGTDALTLIDFGLSYHSARIEDKAVDLHLFRQSLESKHHRVLAGAWRQFLKGYRSSTHAPDVLERLRKVESRGRNKGS